jgi:hypothetical protein
MYAIVPKAGEAAILAGFPPLLLMRALHLFSCLGLLVR